MVSTSNDISAPRAVRRPTSPLRSFPNLKSSPTTTCPTWSVDTSTSVTKASGASSLMAARSSTPTHSTPATPRRVTRSGRVVRRRGWVPGRSTSSGWGSKVRTVRIIVGRKVARSERWPRWTPSSTPIVRDLSPSGGSQPCQGPSSTLTREAPPRAGPVPRPSGRRPTSRRRRRALRKVRQRAPRRAGRRRIACRCGRPSRSPRRR